VEYAFGKKITSIQPNPEWDPYKVEQPPTIIQKHGPHYYIVRSKNGKSIDTAIMFKKSIQEIKERYQITPADENLINRVSTKIALAAKIDAQFIRALLNYINRENQSLPIDAALSLVTHCLCQVMNAEAQISLLKDSGIVTMLNSIKTENIAKVPNSLWRSFITGNLFKYLKIKILRETIIGDNTTANLDRVGPFY
jgi:hypothetical protein